MKKINSLKYIVLAVLFTVLSIAYTASVKAVTINVPEIKSVEMSSVEDKAIKVTWDSKNIGSGYSVELYNLTTGESKRFANSVTHYTFQGLQENQNYRFQIRTCTGDTEDSCSDWSQIKEIEYDNTLKAIILNQSCSTLTLKVGDTTDLTLLKVIPSMIEDEVAARIAWTSSNPGVATVDNNGKVTAVGAGDATITASVDGISTIVGIHVISTDKPLTGISLNKNTLSLETKKTETLIVTYIPSDTTDSKTVTWTSSNTNVATVDNNGKVTAVTAGTAVITAKVGDKTATCTVTVTEPNRPLKSIKLNQKNYYIVKGKTQTMRVIYNPSNTTDNKTITWKVADKKIATFPTLTVAQKTVATASETVAKAAGSTNTNKQQITGVTVGKTTVTATATNKTSATSNVHVLAKAVSMTGISLTTDKPTIYVGKTGTINTIYTPTNTTDTREVEWTSSDTSIATIAGTGVSGEGTVKGIKPGVVTITAKSKAKSAKTASIKITVLEKEVPMTSIKIKKASYEILKNESKTMAGEIIYEPENTTDNRNLEWTSSNSKIAEINKNTGVLKGIKAGTVTITAKSTSKGYTVTATVTVKEIHITGIVLNKSSVSIKKGNTTTLSVKTWKPSNTTDDKTITWSSNNTSIATVSSSGKVTAKKKGTATITAKTINGKKDTCKITVTESSSGSGGGGSGSGGSGGSSGSGGGGGSKATTTTTAHKMTQSECLALKTQLKKDCELDKKHTYSGTCVDGKLTSNKCTEKSSSSTPTNECPHTNCLSYGNATTCKKCGCTWNNNEGHCTGNSSGSGSGASKKPTPSTSDLETKIKECQKAYSKNASYDSKTKKCYCTNGSTLKSACSPLKATKKTWTTDMCRKEYGNGFKANNSATGCAKVSCVKGYHWTKDGCKKDDCTASCMSHGNEQTCRNCGCSWNQKEGHCTGSNSGPSTKKWTTDMCRKEKGNGYKANSSETGCIKASCVNGYHWTKDGCKKNTTTTTAKKWTTDRCRKEKGNGYKANSSETGCIKASCVDGYVWSKDGCHKVTRAAKKTTTKKAAAKKPTTKKPATKKPTTKKPTTKKKCTQKCTQVKVCTRKVLGICTWHQTTTQCQCK